MDILFLAAPQVGDLIRESEALFGAMVILWGYVSRLIGKNAPAIEKIKPVFKVAAGGVVLIVAFVSFGFSDVFPLVFTFLASLGVYDLFLKPAKSLLK